MSQLLQILQTLKDYYTKTLSKELRQFKRHNVYGLVLLSIRQLYFFLLLSNDSIQSSLITIDSNFSGIQTINLTSIDSSLEWVVYLSTCVLLSIIAIVILPPIEISLGIQTSTLRNMLSLVFQSYDYILFIPMISLNLALQSVNRLGIINVVFAILLSLVVKFQDQDFSYNQTDFLRKRNSIFWDVFLLILESLAVFVSALISYDNLNLVVNTCLAAYRVIACVFSRTYSNRLAHLFELFLSLLHTFVSFSITTSIFTDAQFCLTLLIFCFLPVALKIAIEFDCHLRNLSFVYSSKDLSQPDNKQGSQEFDTYLRLLWQQIQTPYEDYKKNASLSIVFENLFTNHQLICSIDPEKCSICQNIQKVKKTLAKLIFLNPTIQNTKYERDSPVVSYTAYFANLKDSQETCLDGSLREKALKGYIISSYKRYFKEQYQSVSSHQSNSNSQIILSYISFLVEVEQSKVMSYIEMIRLKKYVNFSLREEAYLEDLFTSAKDQFDAPPRPDSNLLENELLAATSKKDEKNIFELQNLLLGIFFDESINKAEEKYYQVLRQKYKFLLLLSTDFIDLLAVKQAAVTLMKEKDQLRERLVYLGSINFQSQKLQFYMDNYISYLGFGENKKRLFLQKQKKQQFLSSKQSITNFPAFDKQSCIIFVSLSDKVGTIKRIQNKFENLFGYSIKQTIGKNISIIIPQLVAKYHDLALMNYVEKGSSVGSTSTNNLIKAGSFSGEYSSSSHSTFFPIMIAKNNDNWAVPVSVHFRPECIQLNDCGLSGLIRTINSEYLYIMTNCKSFRVESVSKLFFEKILEKYITKDQLSMIYFNRMIPLLHYFEKQWVAGEDKPSEIHKDLVKTVAFLPKIESIQAGCLIESVKSNKQNPLFEKLGYSSLQREIQRFSIEHYDMYTIKIKFYHQRSSYEPFNIIEIQSIRKISSSQIQRENLALLKNQLKALLNIDFDITYDLKILKKVEQLTSYKQSSSSEEIDENSLEEEDEGQSIQNNLSQITSNQNNNILSIEINHQPHNVTSKHHSSSVTLNPLRRKTDEKQFDLDIGGRFLHTIEQASADSKNILDSSRLKLIQQQYPQESLDLSATRLIPSPVLKYQDYLDQNVHKTSSLLNANQEIIYNNNQSTFLDSQRNDAPEELGTQRADNTYYTTSNLNTDNQMLPTLLISTANNQEKDGNIIDHQQLLPNPMDITQIDKDKKPHSIFWILKERLHQLKLIKLAKKIKKNKETKSTEHDNIITQPKKTKKKSPIETTTHEKRLFYQTNKSNNTMSSQISAQRTMFQTLISGNTNLNSTNQQHLETFLRSYYEMSSSENVIANEKNLNDHKLNRIKKLDQDEEDNNAIIFGGGGSLGGQSSQQISNSMVLEQEQQIMQLSRMSSSVQTSQTNNYEQKHKVRSLLVERRKDSSLRMLNLFGLASIAAITALTIVEYAQIKSLFDEAQQHINNIPWANTMRAMFAFPITYIALKVMLEQNVFGDTSLYDASYGQFLYDRTDRNYNTYKGILQGFYEADLTNKDYFQYINTVTVPLVLSLDDKSVPVAQQLVNVPKNKYTLPLRLQYFINFIYQISYLNKLNDGYDPQPGKIILDNFSTFSSNLTYVQNQVILRSQTVLQSIEDNSYLQLGLVLGVSFTLIFMLFPLYYFVQYKNQEVLKLLGTLTPASLTQMMKQVQLGLYLFSSKPRSIKSDKSLKINSEPLRKKKNIAQTTELSKFHFSLLFIGLFAFTMVIIQPIVTTILIHQYNTEAQINTTLLGTLYDLIAQSSSDHVVAYKYMKSQLLAGDNTYNPGYYLPRSKTLGGTNSAVLAKVSKIVETSQNQSKRQQSLYDNFFYKMLNTNICEALEKYPEYILPANNAIDMSNCAKISSGILTQGFQVAMTKYYQYYAQIYEIFSPGGNVAPQLLLWQKKNNIREFEALSEFLVHTIIVQKDFLLIIMSNDLDYINNVQLILVIWQVSQLLILFSLGWFKFYQYVSYEMFLIRKTLTLLSIDAVLENPYMVSYLTS